MVTQHTAPPTRAKTGQLGLTLVTKGMRRRARPSPGTPRRSLKGVGLFAGIGGLELGLSRAGHETLLLCENDPSANAVLDVRFPEIAKHGDICTLESLPPGTDLLAGGFPCQDLSQAGKTAGIEGSKSGLVGEVFRLLRTHRVPWVLLENVPFMLQLARGKALEVIVASMEELGYRWAYRIVDSRAFGLPQRRQRVFFLASLQDDPRSVLFTDDLGERPTGERDGRACGFYWTEGIRGLGWAVNAVPTLKGGSTIGIPSAPAIILPSGEIVKPDLRDMERMQGFPSDWTKPAEAVAKRGARYKLVGNAITVDVAAWLGQRLAAPGTYRPVGDAPLRPGAPWPAAAYNVGTGRFSAPLSKWPAQRRERSLERFLRYAPEPLSAKATAGFLSRARSGSLRFPDGFLDAVENHLRRMEAAAAA